MSNKKATFVTYVISISFILASLLLSVHFYCYNRNFYTKEHNSIQLYGKGIAEYIGISDDDLYELTDFTLDYLNNPDSSLNKQMLINGELREVYTNDEKAHMEDVRKLNLNAVYIMHISLCLFIISIVYYFVNKGSITLLTKNYIKALLITLAIFSVIGGYILVDFNSFWTNFHHIFFAGNDLWLLDLRKDILIMIVPPEFFNHLVIRIVIMFVVLIVAFWAILKLVRKFIYD